MLTDFDSIVNPEVPLEPVIDEFIASPAQVALDPAAPPADMSMVMLKPDPTMVDTLKDEFENTPYDTTTGWDGTGVGAGEGGVSAGGILANHYTNVDPSALMTLDHCKYGNDHEGACLDTPTSEIAVNKISTCGAPWTCPDISGISAAEQEKCTAMQSTWYANRIDFEDNCWNAPADLQAPRTGSSGGGFCEGTGTDAYSRMITDKRAPQSCDPKTVTNYDTGVIAFGSGKYLRSQPHRGTVAATHTWTLAELGRSIYLSARIIFLSPGSRILIFMCIPFTLLNYLLLRKIPSTEAHSHHWRIHWSGRDLRGWIFGQGRL